VETTGNVGALERRRQQIENPLSRLILEGKFGAKDHVHVDYGERAGFTFNPAHAMAA
jgi:hypothetical protein